MAPPRQGVTAQQRATRSVEGSEAYSRPADLLRRLQATTSEDDDLSRAVKELVGRMPVVLCEEIQIFAEKYGLNDDELKRALRKGLKHSKGSLIKHVLELEKACNKEKAAAAFEGRTYTSSSAGDCQGADDAARPSQLLEQELERRKAVELTSRLKTLQLEKSALEQDIARLQKQLEGDDQHTPLVGFFDKIRCNRRQRLAVGKFASAPAKTGSSHSSKKPDPLQSTFKHGRKQVDDGMQSALSTSCSSLPSTSTSSTPIRQVAWTVVNNIPNTVGFMCDLATLDVLKVTDAAAGALKVRPREFVGENFLSLLAQPQRGPWLHKAIQTHHALAYLDGAPMDGQDVASTALGSFVLKSRLGLHVHCNMSVVHLQEDTVHGHEAAVLIVLECENAGVSSGAGAAAGDARVHDDSDARSEVSDVSIAPSDSVSNIGFRPIPY
eukprot:TRINITY_DN36715_c0_g2_i7.p1 TRINITY_DN36715_c0_g2~~TRINITY_DN36715_c0_g2_i7.p1  ORF type:complete len:475 (+),score=85.64 TRINITY_DN36715_c0_g2_i7:111-1427(+)